MRLLSLVFLAACGGSPKTSTAPSGPVSCDQVGTHVAGVLGDPADPRTPKMAAVFTNRCTTDAWSDDIKHCFAAISDGGGAGACAAKLPKAQGDALTADGDAVVKGS